jgi:hypothetical protein
VHGDPRGRRVHGLGHLLKWGLGFEGVLKVKIYESEEGVELSRCKQNTRLRTLALLQWEALIGP